MFFLAPLVAPISGAVASAVAVTAGEVLSWIAVGSAAVALADDTVDVVKKAKHIFDDEDEDVDK